MKIKYATPIFILFLLGVSFFYKYHEIVFKRPQSVHQWRQSDCASITLNYYQGGMNFFNPETHNLTSDAGTSGKNCTSEIPILYYSVAVLYKIFGYHDSIYRIFNSLLFFLGLFYLFRIFLYLLKDTYWAIALTLLFFTSPVLVYYGNNYLSNSSSLAFSIVGWYYFIRFWYEKKQNWFYLSMAIFLIAAALKVTALFSLFAIIGVYVLELFGLMSFGGNQRLFNQKFRFSIPFISILIIIGLWIFYASQYNSEHDSTYFSTTLFPIWDLDSAQINDVLSKIRTIWLDQYFHQSVLLFILICFFFSLINFRKNSKLLIFIVLFIVVEVIAYIILQFWTFANHDYYTINMYILLILLVITSFDLLKRHFNKIFSSKIFKVLFSFFLLFNIYYAHQKIDARYEGWMNDIAEKKDIHIITPYLRQIGIMPNDTIISIPDGSHVTLYLMNQKGWTEYTDTKFNKGEKIRYNQDSIGIQSSINKGAKYLIINGVKELYKKPYLASYCSNLIGNFNNVLIFNLEDQDDNFSLENRTIDTEYFCNAELLSKDSKYFMNANDSTFFQFGLSQNDEFAYSGKYSSKLDVNSPYGMTIKCKALKNGESFGISVWRKSNHKSKGGIVASSSPNIYYNNEYEILETDSNGWEKIFMEIFITPELADQELVIYVYNPEPGPMYFDDLKIVRYKSILNEISRKAL